MAFLSGSFSSLDAAWTAVLLPCAILLGYAVVVTAVAAKMFRRDTL